jgi:hypothetical protein
MEGMFAGMWLRFQCLAGIVGVEGINPTCAAQGYHDAWLPVLFAWSPVVTVVSITCAVPLALLIIRRLLEVIGRED